MRRLVLPAALALLTVPPACGKPPATRHDLDTLDQQLTDGGSDPAAIGALRDQILVDPRLAQSSNARAVRPAPRPDPGAMPPDDLGAPADTSRPGDLRPTPAATPGCPQCAAHRGAITLGALAERQSAKSVAACAPSLAYATIWSTRLPAALPLYPDARVGEAAGTDAAGCALRVVSFASAAPLSRVSDWYYAHLTRAGFMPEHRSDGSEHVLGGEKGGAAFMVYLRPRAGGGTDVDLVSNAGR